MTLDESIIVQHWIGVFSDLIKWLLADKKIVNMVTSRNFRLVIVVTSKTVKLRIIRKP